MVAHHVYAFIDSGKIQQLQLCSGEEEATRIAKICYPQGYSINVDNYPVRVGDIHLGGSFFRPNEDGGQDEVEVLPIQSLESKLLSCRAIIQDQKDEIAYLKGLLHDRDESSSIDEVEDGENK